MAGEVDVQQLVQEFRALHDKHKSARITPAEQARWAELKHTLSVLTGSALPDHAP